MLSTITTGNSFGNVTNERAVELRKQENEFVRSKVDTVHKNSDMDVSLYDKYNVKIGLRNKNGTGVCVGLTHVADVCGYSFDENGEKQPSEGKLFYRGIDV